MCEFKAIPSAAGGGKINIDCVCEISGKPITESNKYGMYCEDFCGKNDDAAAGKMLDKMMLPLKNEDISKEEAMEQMLGGLMQMFEQMEKGKDDDTE